MKTFKLRMSLFRIWFMKNILVFIQIVAIVLCILVFTGVLPSSTPIFGKMIAEIKEAKGDATGWINTAAVLVSCLSSISVFMLKARTIALSDIKSDKLKYAMYKAGLYFDEKGHLTKKVEKITQKDLDGDGKIGDKDVGEAKVSAGFFSGFINAIKELFAIATVKIDEDAPEEEAMADALEETNLTESAEGVKELDNLIFKTKPDVKKEEETETKTENKKEKKEKKYFYDFKFRTQSEIDELKAAKVAKKAKKKEDKSKEKDNKSKKEEDKTDKLDNGMQIMKVESKEETKISSTSAIPPQPKSTQKPSSKDNKNVNDFLTKLKNKR